MAQETLSHVLLSDDSKHTMAADTESNGSFMGVSYDVCKYLNSSKYQVQERYAAEHVGDVLMVHRELLGGASGSGLNGLPKSISEAD